MGYTTKNYMANGGDKLVIGGSIEFDNGGLMPNQEENSAGTTATLKADLNALLKKLKNAGLMAADVFTISVAACSAAADPNANRAYNTGKVSSVAYSEGVITITLNSGIKVKDLKDFDGGSGWGTHKWLGVGVSAGMTLTSLYYNGAALTAEDITEATEQGGLESNYFVRWVAADLVLAGDNTQKSKDTFTLWADGYAKTPITLKIVEG